MDSWSDEFTGFEMGNFNENWVNVILDLLMFMVSVAGIIQPPKFYPEEERNYVSPIFLAIESRKFWIGWALLSVLGLIWEGFKALR
jgi:hypothetical protein